MSIILFSQRYSDLIDFGNGESKDYICGAIEWQTKKKIVSIMCKFAEPQIIQPDRYDSYQVTTDALSQAISRLNEHIGYDLYDLQHPFSTSIFMRDAEEQLAARFSFAPHLFDLIELQHNELSAKEAADFHTQINALLRDENVPWLLCDGRMIKIDAKQFELDMKAKTLDRLNILKDSEPEFQSAFEELMRSCESYEKSEYSDAVLYAEKSYESTLKVICNVAKGAADKLCQNYLSNILGSDLPQQMKADGFKDKVMMSLPYIRNNTAAGHGAGSITSAVPKPMANLAINLAAALITFLIEQYVESKVKLPGNAEHLQIGGSNGAR